MLRAEKHLENYYKQYPNDEITNFLKSFGCYMYYDEIYSSLKNFKFDKDEIQSFNKLVDLYYNKYTKNLIRYDQKDILKSIYNTNLKQYNNLNKNNFTINFFTANSTQGKNWVASKEQIKQGVYNFESEEFIVNKNKNIKKRKIVFYYKTGDAEHTTYNNSTKVGVDVFQQCLIYKIIEKLIKNKFLKNFNDLVIVPKFENGIPEFISKDLNFNVKICNHTEYLNECCLYANPFHFYGGDIESAFSFTKPIICSTILIQRPYSNLFHDYFYMPFYFHKGKVFDKKIMVDGYDGDNELQMKYGEKGFNYCERMMKYAKNNSLDSLFKTLIDRIVLLDQSI